MAQTVDGDLYFSITGELLEIACQVRKKRGYPFDPGRLHASLQNLVEGRFIEMVNANPPQPYGFGVYLDGLTLHQHEEMGHLMPFKQGQTLYLNGKEVLLYRNNFQDGESVHAMARGQQSLNSAMCAFLNVNEAYIPPIWWKEDAIYFHGSSFKNQGGRVFVPGFRKRDGRWFVSMKSLDDIWTPKEPAVILA